MNKKQKKERAMKRNAERAAYNVEHADEIAEQKRWQEEWEANEQKRNQELIKEDERILKYKKFMVELSCYSDPAISVMGYSKPVWMIFRDHYPTEYARMFKEARQKFPNQDNGTINDAISNIIMEMVAGGGIPG